MKITKSRVFIAKCGWHIIDSKKIYFRSKWEANYARYLQFKKDQGLIKEWEHEPKTFWFEGIKRGCVSYLPDFKVTNNDDTHYWIEVKGFYDAKSLTKIKRFRSYFPNEILILIDQMWFKINSCKCAALIKDWEK